jgi:hypothetical protein
MESTEKPTIQIVDVLANAGAGGIDDRALAVQSLIEHTQSGGPPRIAIVISGIRSNADWVDRVIQQNEQFSKGEIAFKKAKSKRLSIWHLATRWGLRRERESLRNQIFNLLIQYPNAEFSIVCHSLGTDLVADCLKEINYRFKFIVLLGSICKTSKLSVFRKSCDYVINDRGSHDRFTIIAALLSPWFYEPTGTFGFNTSYANDQVFLNDHDSCAEAPHVLNAVVPRLLGQGTLPLNLFAECFYSHNTYAYSVSFFRALLAFSMGFLVYAYFGGPKWSFFLSGIAFLAAVAIPTLYFVRKPVLHSN